MHFLERAEKKYHRPANSSWG